MNHSMKKITIITIACALVAALPLQAHVKQVSKKTTAKTASSNHGIRTAKSEAEMNSIIKAGRPTIVIITTTWCEACKQTDPQFKQVATELKDKITFVTVDGDKVRIKGIDAYPTIKAYDNGKPATLYTEKGKKTNQLPWTSETIDLRREVSKLIH